MSTSYFMNIGAYVATVIFAAARLAVGGVLTEPGALVPALLVLGILLIPLASKGGFQKSTYQTGPAFGLAWGVLYALTPAQLSSDRISGVLEASLEGLSFSFKDNLAVFCIGLLLLVGLSAVRKYFPNAALNVLRYAILTLMQLLAFEGMRSRQDSSGCLCRRCCSRGCSWPASCGTVRKSPGCASACWLASFTPF